MTTIPGVSNNELVRTTWGNAVATELNTNSVRKNGRNAANTAAEQMTGPLILPTTQSTDAHAAVHKTYVDATFVNIAGDTMTGQLIINPGATDEGIRIRGANANLAFYNDAGTARSGYVAASSGLLTVGSESAVMAFSTDVGGVAERMRLQGASLLIGKTSDELTSAGTTIGAGGSSTEGSIRSVIAASGALTNLFGRHIGTADAENQYFLILQRASGTTVGSIAQGDGNNSIFNAGPGGSHPTTSDYRLKDDLGPIVDPVARLMQLAPKHLRWRPESGSVGEFDNFIAHEVQAVVPEAVVGAKDAVWPADSPVNPGGVQAQGLDPAKLVPLLTAALQEALIAVSDLTDRVAALEAAA